MRRTMLPMPRGRGLLSDVAEPLPASLLLSHSATHDEVVERTDAEEERELLNAYDAVVTTRVAARKDG